ncbi:MAG: hypothetical protein CMB80_01230 [Flammeovirgaceae bacterium]|nr:hypothetical protein [Flammeovirgaceae bacterium]
MGGGEVYLSLYHSPGWDEGMARSLLTFIDYQDYVTEVGMCGCPGVVGGSYSDFGDLDITHDLHKAEEDRNPECFPEWSGPPWPGDCAIQKRYAVHFDVDYNPEETWLTAPKSKDVDIVFHMPLRRSVRGSHEWVTALVALQDRLNKKVVVLAGGNDSHEWTSLTDKLDVVVPETYLETADYINSSNLFIGGASSCNVCAEGLKKFRMVEVAAGCDNIYAKGETGFTINEWSVDDIILFAARLSESER